MSVYISDGDKLISEITFVKFPNNEKRLDLSKEQLENINKTKAICFKYIDDNSIFELLLLNDILYTQNIMVDLYFTYMPYSRMDRIKDNKTAFGLKTTAKLINSLESIRNIFIFEPHSEQTIKLVKNANTWNKNFYIQTIQKLYENQLFNLKDDWICFPDISAKNRYMDRLEELNIENILVANKIRNFETGKIEKIEVEIYSTKEEKNKIQQLENTLQLENLNETKICDEEIANQLNKEKELEITNINNSDSNQKLTETSHSKQNNNSNNQINNFEQKNQPTSLPARIYFIDDLCSYGGTFIGCKKVLPIQYSQISLIVAHCENSILKGEILGEFDNVYTTDSIFTNFTQKPSNLCVTSILDAFMREIKQKILLDSNEQKALKTKKQTERG